VGGQFGTIAGQRRHALAALDATTGAATTWNPDPEGGAGLGTILAFAVSGPTVYVGGTFATTAQISGDGVTHWDGRQVRAKIAPLPATARRAAIFRVFVRQPRREAAEWNGWACDRSESRRETGRVFGYCRSSRA
jgi:hypothetical protein